MTLTEYILLRFSSPLVIVNPVAGVPAFLTSSVYFLWYLLPRLSGQRRD